MLVIIISQDVFESVGGSFMQNREPKKHFKMYKAGKRWMVAGIVTLTTVGGLTIGASADSASQPATSDVKIEVPAASGTASQTDQSQNVAPVKSEQTANDSTTKTDQGLAANSQQDDQSSQQVTNSVKAEPQTEQKSQNAQPNDSKQVQPVSDPKSEQSKDVSNQPAKEQQSNDQKTDNQADNQMAKQADSQTKDQNAQPDSQMAGQSNKSDQNADKQDEKNQTNPVKTEQDQPKVASEKSNQETENKTDDQANLSDNREANVAQSQFQANHNNVKQAVSDTINGTWGSANYVYDKQTGTLSFNDGGNLGNEFAYDSWLEANHAQVQHVVFNSKVSVNDANGLFAYWSSVQDYQNLYNLDTSNCTKMTNMFLDNHSLKSLDLTGMNTSNVTDMDAMFYTNAGLDGKTGTQLKYVNLGGIDTSKVTRFYNAFKNDRLLSRIDGLNQLDTSNVTEMNSMFADCYSLQSLDLSSFNTSKADTTNMLANDSNLNELKLGKDTILGISTNLPNVPSQYAGWVQVDANGKVIPYQEALPSNELADGNAHPGTWIWGNPIKDESSMHAQGITIYAGNQVPTDAAAYNAAATNADGSVSAITKIDTSKVNNQIPGQYPVTITAANGQSMTVTVTVIANQANITAHGISIYVGDSVPTDPAAYGATATNEDGTKATITKINTLNVNNQVPGQYQVAITASNGKTFFVPVTVLAKNGSKPDQPGNNGNGNNNPSTPDNNGGDHGNGEHPSTPNHNGGNNNGSNPVAPNQPSGRPEVPSQPVAPNQPTGDNGNTVPENHAQNVPETPKKPAAKPEVPSEGINKDSNSTATKSTNNGEQAISNDHQISVTSQKSSQKETPVTKTDHS
ncbi:cell wall anchor domain-containing protein [Fructilactobacillus fructivorans]|nr:cell wall anchor domain-containing protein [Fructilactobacillus fructivorans]